MLTIKIMKELEQALEVIRKYQIGKDIAVDEFYYGVVLHIDLTLSYNQYNQIKSKI